MKNILIVEDEPHQMHCLKIILKEYNNNFIIHTASNAIEASDIYNNKTIDLFILDVDLSSTNSDKNGIDIGISLRADRPYSNTPIIYITGVPEKMHSAVNDVHCYNYLLKPYKKEDIHKALNDVINSKKEIDTTYTLRDINGVRITLKYDDLIYVKAMHHTLTFFTCNGPFSSRESKLNDLSKYFPSKFVRVHKSYVVNLSYIDAYDKTTRIISINKESIHVGRTYKDNFEAIYS